MRIIEFMPGHDVYEAVLDPGETPEQANEELTRLMFSPVPWVPVTPNRKLKEYRK